MTFDRGLDQDLPELLADLALEPTPDYRDIVVRRTAAMRQRPAWMFPERWLPMNTASRPMAVIPIPIRRVSLVAVLLLLIAAIAWLAVSLGRPGPRRIAPPYGPAGNGLIAYGMDVYGTPGDLYVADPVTGSSRAIVTGPETDHNPVFSKTGDRLAFLRETAAGDLLMIANADGSNVRPLIDAPFVNVTSADWSADGRTMVITSDLGDRHGMSIVDVDRGTLRPLDMGRDVGGAAFVPPTDTEIAFSMEGSAWAVKTDGTGLRAVAPSDVFRYSPNGSMLTYTAWDKAADGSERSQVHVIDVASGTDRTLPNPAGVQYQGSAAWSPDGTRLLLMRAYATGDLRFVIVPADGIGPDLELPYQATGGFGDLSWSPDGTKVILGAANPMDDEVVDIATGSTASMQGWVTPNWQRAAP